MMHFYESLEVYGLGPVQGIRILIQGSYISDSFKTVTLESSDTWKTSPEANYMVEKVQNLIENKQAMIVKVNNENEVITQSEISTFEDPVETNRNTSS